MRLRVVALVCLKKGVPAKPTVCHAASVSWYLPGELLRVGISLEMHEGVTLVAALSTRNPTLLPVVQGKVQIPEIMSDLVKMRR